VVGDLSPWSPVCDLADGYGDVRGRRIDGEEQALGSLRLVRIQDNRKGVPPIAEELEIFLGRPAEMPEQAAGIPRLKVIQSAK